MLICRLTGKGYAMGNELQLQTLQDDFTINEPIYAKILKLIIHIILKKTFSKV